ncbi:MAG: hypothetical protein M3036_18210, partial [Bifidobacteriales bacterium]|nr:hypothetical protein [Bifidobacteriales bacterium]
MDSATRCRFSLDCVARFQAAQIVPQADAAPEQDRSDRNVKTIDKARLEEVANDSRTTANPHIFAARRTDSLLKRINRGGLEEVESGAAGHLYGGSRVAGE